MTKRVLTPLHVVAASTGVFITATEIASNTEHMMHQTGTLFDPAVAAAVAVSIGVTITLACAIQAFRQWNVLTGTWLFLAFALGAGYTLSTTFDRVATARDRAMAKVWASDPQHQEIFAIYQRVAQKVALECGAGNGPRCEANRASMVQATSTLYMRRGELDSMGKRFAALTGNRVSVDTASSFQPMLMPVALFLMGAFLVAFGIGGQRVPPEFDTGLTGRAAIEGKTKRFVAAFRAEHGRDPKPTEIARAIGVTSTQARRLLK